MTESKWHFRLYGWLYSVIFFLFGFALWFAWAKAHMLYMLPGWVHSWVLTWFPHCLMLMGALGVIATERRYRSDSRRENLGPGGKRHRKEKDASDEDEMEWRPDERHTKKQQERQRKREAKEPFLISGIILSVIALLVIALSVMDAMRV